jgi:hypothetical protein
VPPHGDAAAARIAALQARGAAQADPVGWAYAQALARRAAGHAGATRQWLDQRLAQALDTLDARCDAATATPLTAVASDTQSPLAALLQHLQTLSQTTAPQAAEPGGEPNTAPGADELKTVQRHRSTWARLRTDQQLARSRARVPDNSGPLNSHRLVLRALQRMQDTAPAYLQHLLAHAETLLWLEQANAGSMPAADRPPRPGRAPRGSKR